MKTRIKRRAAILILAAVLLTSLCPTALAEAEIPKEEVSPYRIVLTAPGGWNSSNSAVIKVSLQDPSGLGWYRIEYRVNDGNWHDCEDLFDHGEAEIAVRENGTFTLRVLDPHGHPFEETAAVRTIDLAAPTVQVEINGDILRVEARDDLSGVAGVQVNSLLFTDPINHVVTVSLDESMARFDQLSIRAFTTRATSQNRFFWRTPIIRSRIPRHLNRRKHPSPPENPRQPQNQNRPSAPMDWAARSSTFPTMVIPPPRRRRSPHLSRLFRRSIFPSDRECPTKRTATAIRWMSCIPPRRTSSSLPCKVRTETPFIW